MKDILQIINQLLCNLEVFSLFYIRIYLVKLCMYSDQIDLPLISPLKLGFCSSSDLIRKVSTFGVKLNDITVQ